MTAAGSPTPLSGPAKASVALLCLALSAPLFPGCADPTRASGTPQDAKEFLPADTSRVMGPSGPPRRLSETGLFSSTRDLAPARGVIAYTVNVPLWSDHALKERLVAFPEGGKVEFHEREPWVFPRGTVFIKTFLMETTRGRPESARRLETRLWIHRPEGWRGYTYTWNAEGTDADLLEGRKVLPLTVDTVSGPEKQDWVFPSREDCMDCHTKAAGWALGPKTAQLNLEREGQNQLAAWERLGVFSRPLPMPPDRLDRHPDWDRDRGEVGVRVRAYLDANCANCHNAKDVNILDLRYGLGLKETLLLDGAVVPGKPEKSDLYRRISLRNHKDQMPPLASNLVDLEAQALIREWIRSLEGKE